MEGIANGTQVPNRRFEANEGSLDVAFSVSISSKAYTAEDCTFRKPLLPPPPATSTMPVASNVAV
jgi:hypothetical protein